MESPAWALEEEPLALQLTDALGRGSPALSSPAMSWRRVKALRRDSFQVVSWEKLFWFDAQGHVLHGGVDLVRQHGGVGHKVVRGLGQRLQVGDFLVQLLDARWAEASSSVENTSAITPPWATRVPSATR